MQDVELIKEVLEIMNGNIGKKIELLKMEF